MNKRVWCTLLVATLWTTPAAWAAPKRPFTLEWYQQFFPPGLYYETTLHHDAPGSANDYVEIKRTWIHDFDTRREELVTAKQILLLIKGEAYALNPDKRQGSHFDPAMFDEPIPDRLLHYYSPLFAPEDVTRHGRHLTPSGNRSFQGTEFNVYTHRDHDGRWEFWFGSRDHRLKRIMLETPRTSGGETTHIETFTRAEINKAVPDSLFAIPKDYAITEVKPPAPGAPATSGEPAAGPQP